jgi:hypothetical protein
LSKLGAKEEQNRKKENDYSYYNLLLV